MSSNYPSTEPFNAKGWRPTIFFYRRWWRIRQNYVWKRLDDKQKTELLKTYQHVAFLNACPDRLEHARPA